MTDFQTYTNVSWEILKHHQGLDRNLKTFSPLHNEIIRIIIPLSVGALTYCETSLRLAEEGEGFVDYPLLRSALEYSITLQWLTCFPEAGLEELLTQFRNSSIETIKLRESLLAEDKEKNASQLLALKETRDWLKSQNSIHIRSAKTFGGMLDDMKPVVPIRVKRFKAYYASLSEYTHPRGVILEQGIISPAENQKSFIYRNAAESVLPLEEHRCLLCEILLLSYAPYLALYRGQPFKTDISKWSATSSISPWLTESGHPPRGWKNRLTKKLRSASYPSQET